MVDMEQKTEENSDTEGDDNTEPSPADSEIPDVSVEGNNEEENNEERPEEATEEDDDGGFWRKKRQAATTAEIPRDPKPLEGGVAHTRSGTVAIGPVLMGIAAGTEPQTAKVNNKILTSYSIRIA